jgi:hypothetical protein
MQEELEPKRARTPGKRYPGASLTEVIALLKEVDVAGGSISTGLLASKLGRPQTGSPFLRLLASAKSYGLTEYAGKNNELVRLTADGEAAVGPDEPERLAALKRALIRPEIFATVADALKGRQIPPQDAMIDRFKNAGVAPSGAALAATNFVDSAEEAGAVTTVGERKNLSAELPFEEVLASSEAASRSGGAAVRADSTPRSPRGAVSTGPNPLPLKPDPRATVTSGHVGLTVNLDVSTWDIDKVVELIGKLRAHTQ